MSNLVMHIPIPNKQANPSRTFHGGAPTPRRRVAAAASRRSCSLQCSSRSPMTTRRSANYKPPFWDFYYIQSLNTQYTEERYSTRVAELIVQVKMLPAARNEEFDFVPRLELIDDLQRPSISHHFHDEINQILNSIYCKIYDEEERDLYTTALVFRLLRDHGFRVSQDVFDCFKNDKGDFGSSIGDDTRGVLQLYEASFLLTEGEESLELAKDFATKFLQRKVDKGDDEMDENVLASLELPIHWRIQRPNARWFIEAYGKTPQMNPIVLELAKLDFHYSSNASTRTQTYLEMVEPNKAG